jgi:hypothetical protein
MTFSSKFTGAWIDFRSPFHSFMTVVVGTLVILLTGLTLSSNRYFSARKTDGPLLKPTTNKVR